ncbi:MAG: hypothetical protein H6739_21910 [Alphaproteobacteria bacterium]|nr:hypothetical protein [Alphaproteobacteria bacterium]
MLPLLLIACTGTKGPETLGDDWFGEVTFTVEGGAGGTEAVEMQYIGWSEVEGEDRSVLAAASDDGVYELRIILDRVSAAGTYTPRSVRYRKGQQALRDAQADCAVDIVDSTDPNQPWAGRFSCTDLHTDEGLTEGDEAPWSIVDGAFTGGAFTTLSSPDEGLGAAGYTLHVELLSGPLGGDVLDERTTDHALVVPWRAGETWVEFEDGEDDSLDDVVFKLTPATDQVTVERWTRPLLAEGSAAQLVLTATDIAITAAIEGSGAEQTGELITLRLWDDLTEGSDDLVVFVY